MVPTKWVMNWLVLIWVLVGLQLTLLLAAHSLVLFLMMDLPNVGEMGLEILLVKWVMLCLQLILVSQCCKLLSVIRLPVHCWKISLWNAGAPALVGSWDKAVQAASAKAKSQAFQQLMWEVRVTVWWKLQSVGTMSVRFWTTAPWYVGAMDLEDN